MPGSGFTGKVQLSYCPADEMWSAMTTLSEDVTALLVTPGVRFAGSARGDQARVATPRQALDAGADLLVVGRPITGAADIATAARSVAKELDSA